MLSLRNLRPALIAPLHAAVPVLVHDEFMGRPSGESEIVCAGITTANRRYFPTFAESPSDRTAGRYALVVGASTSGLPPRARRPMSGNAPLRRDDHQSIPGVSYDDI